LKPATQCNYKFLKLFKLNPFLIVKIRNNAVIIFLGWYEKLDAWFASADEVPIRQLESKVVYSYHSNTSLSSYIRNIDVAFDRSYRCTERNVFYASIFLILAGDDKERTVLTRQSVSRAFDAFQINNRSIFNTFIYELLEDKDSVM
jgi:hypothetical protein